MPCFRVRRETTNVSRQRALAIPVAEALTFGFALVLLWFNRPSRIVSEASVVGPVEDGESARR